MTADASTHRILTSRGEFLDALREGFRLAQAAGCREILIGDEDFADWPLSERAVLQALTDWAYAHRRLTVLARHFDDVVRRHARWVEWRRQWSHIVDCRAMDDADAGACPALLLAPGAVVVRLLDRDNFRASVSNERSDELRARELIDACLQRSAPSFPATTLGL
jgi:hypothetical protein